MKECCGHHHKFDTKNVSSIFLEHMINRRMQNEEKIPRWEPLHRLGMLFGCSTLHCHKIFLILNHSIGLISPQHYLVFDETFRPFQLHVME